MNTNNHHLKNRKSNIGAAIALAVGVGLAFANTMDNLGAGLLLGAAFGIILAVAQKSKPS